MPYIIVYFSDLFTVTCQNLQVEAYRDMITPVVDAFKYLTQVVAIILSMYIFLMFNCNYCMIYECSTTLLLYQLQLFIISIV